MTPNCIKDNNALELCLCDACDALDVRVLSKRKLTHLIKKHLKAEQLVSMLDLSKEDTYWQARLGRSYLLTDDAKSKEGVDLLKSSAKSGHPLAMAWLSLVYFYGFGVDVDKSLAFDYVTMAKSCLSSYVHPLLAHSHETILIYGIAKSCF